MYNDPSAIRMLTERVITEIGWKELFDRTISEKYVYNLVRGIIRPSDDFSEASQRRIVSEAVSALRRIYAVGKEMRRW